MIGSMRLDGTTACLAVDSPTDRDVFREYIRLVLVPSLRPGDIVVLDNLSAHGDKETQQLVEAAQARIQFLPPYSPDLTQLPQFGSLMRQNEVLFKDR